MSLFYILYFVYFGVIFLTCIILWKLEKISKNNIYLIIPIVSTGFWALHWLIFINFFAETSFYDFGIYYYSGRQIWINPRRFYIETWFGYDIGIAYLPFFSFLWAISLSLIPYTISYFIWYMMLVIIVILFILEFNKILIMLGLEEKSHRFLFLIIISNGWPVFHQFALCQSKFLVGLIIFYILRMELQYNKEEREKSLKYYCWIYFLFVLLVGMVPYLLFLLLIYLFHDIQKDELLEKKNLKKYGIIAIWFLAQNFLFLLHPILIIDFLKVWIGFQERQYELRHFYLIFINDIFSIPNIIELTVSLILLIIMYIIIIFLIINKKINLINKFSLFAISIIFLNYLSYRIFVFLLPLALLLFIPFIKQEIQGKEFIKENKIVLYGIVSIAGIYLTVDKVNPYYPSFEGMTVIYLISIIILGICLLILYKEKMNIIEEET